MKKASNPPSPEDGIRPDPPPVPPKVEGTPTFKEGSSSFSQALRRPNVVLLEVAVERAHQDKKWGGPEHDDQYTALEFLQLVERYAILARVMSSRGSPGKARHRLIRVAALAIAAVESIDRKAP